MAALIWTYTGAAIRSSKLLLPRAVSIGPLHGKTQRIARGFAQVAWARRLIISVNRNNVC